MRALMFFAPLFRTQWKGFGLALLLSLVAIAAGTALLGVSGWFLTATALAAMGVSFNLFAPSAAVRGFSFIRIVARYFEKLVGHNATLRLLSDTRRWLFGALFPRLPLPGRSLRHGDLVSRLTADVDALDNLFLLAIGPLLAAITLAAAMTVIVFWLLPQAGWIYFCASLVSVIAVPAALIAATRRNGHALVEAAAGLRGRVLDAVIGLEDIRAFGQQAHFATRFAEASRQASALNTRQGLATSLAAGSVQLLAGLTVIAVLVIGLAAHQAGTIEGPLLAGLIFAVLGSFEATNMVVRSVGKFGASLASAERLHAIATLEPAIREPLKPSVLGDDNTIAFRNVHFAYGNGEPVLDGMNLTILPGEHVVIEGPSGSGKSTILALLLRLADPQSGHVAIGGIDLRHLESAEIHRRIALLSQSSPVFYDTIRNNLLIARPEAKDAELWNALERARLADTVHAMPRGLDTLIGETGSTLSAGQARRLCLARTLLSPAPIVALDEPTVGFDAETEDSLLDELPDLLAGRTLILVTHAQLPKHYPARRLTLNTGLVLEDRS